MYTGFVAEDRWQLSTCATLSTKQPWAGHGSEPLTLQARQKADLKALLPEGGNKTTRQSNGTSLPDKCKQKR